MDEGDAVSLPSGAPTDLAASSAPSAGSSSLARPQEPREQGASAVFPLAEFPPLIVILQANAWCVFVIYRHFVSQRGF